MRPCKFSEILDERVFMIMLIDAKAGRTCHYQTQKRQKLLYFCSCRVKLWILVAIRSK